MHALVCWYFLFEWNMHRRDVNGIRGFYKLQDGIGFAYIHCLQCMGWLKFLKNWAKAARNFYLSWALGEV